MDLFAWLEHNMGPAPAMFWGKIGDRKQKSYNLHPTGGEGVLKKFREAKFLLIRAESVQG